MKLYDRHLVEQLLHGRQHDILASVQQAYMLHASHETELPFSTFLRPPGHPHDRIIGLPAYLGGDDPVAGIKWISSFPGNLARGLQRASSVMILNDLATGYPTALLESSQISSWRTAASAALASVTLHQDQPVTTVGMLGCGTINLRTVDFLSHVHPEISTVLLHDPVPERAMVFARHAQALVPGAEIIAAPTLDNLLEASQTLSIATTDSSHWLQLPPPATDTAQVVLHLSLRDLTPQTILASCNVVDDADHVSRENTSLDLAQQLSGSRDFIAADLGSLLTGDAHLPTDPRRIVFSPFGLGILDLAVARHITRLGSDRAAQVGDFDPGCHATATASREAIHV